MAYMGRLRAIRARLRSLAATGALEPGQEKDIAKGLRKLERGLKTHNEKMLRAGIDQICRALLRG